MTTNQNRPEAPRLFVSQGPGVPPSRAQISHAVAVGGICHIGGQLSVSASGAYVSGSATEEAARAFQNVFAVLDAAGFTKEDLVFLDLAFDSLDDLASVSALYNDLFPTGRRPCRVVHQAAALPYGARIRVSGVAIRTTVPVR